MGEDSGVDRKKINEISIKFPNISIMWAKMKSPYFYKNFMNYISFSILYVVWLIGTNLSFRSSIDYLIQIILSICLFLFLLFFNVKNIKSRILYILLIISTPLFMYNFYRLYYSILFLIIDK